MGMIGISQQAAPVNHDSAHPATPAKSAFGNQTKPASLRATTRVIHAPRFTRVFISSRTGFSVHGIVRSVSRAGIQILTPVPVPIRCPLDIAIVGCRPIAGEALYCIKRAPVHRVGIVLSSQHKPSLEVGSVADICSLDPPFTVGRGSILAVRGSRASIFSKAAIPPGSWVRIESSTWILFGVVKDMVPTGMVGRYLEVHLEAAFPGDPAEPEDVETQTQTLVLPEPAGQEGIEL